MFKMVCVDLKIMIQKNAFRLIPTVLFGMFLVTILISIFFGRSLGDEKSRILLYELIASVWAVYAIYLIVRQIPLRIVPALYACAAGEKEKMQYIRIQFGIKFLFSLLLIPLIHYIGIGDFLFFFYKDRAGAAIQMILLFFLLWNLNLRVGTGENRQNLLDERGCEKLSKDEFLVHAIWFGILVIEAMIFLCRAMYMVLALGIPPVMTMKEIWFWTAAMIGNLFFAVGCTPRILKMALSYENIYRPEAKKGGITHEYMP